MTNKETKLLGALFPAHKDLLPILDRIREKYDLPIGGIVDKQFIEFIYSGRKIPWEEIRAVLKYEIENTPDLWEEPLARLLKTARETPEALTDIDAYMQELGTENEQVRMMVGLLTSQIAPLVGKIQEFIDTAADLLLTWLATGETKDIPFDWVGAVGIQYYFGEPVVFAIAGPFSDPKEISQMLTAKHRETYGRDRYRISGEFLNNVDFLRMKLENVPLKDIADEYIQHHRSQFPKDETSLEYRKSKGKLEERLKKQFQRHLDTLSRMLGDDKQSK